MRTETKAPPANATPRQAGRIRVFLLCSGLGRVNRGYESFTRECFDAISREPAVEITLFKGAGRSCGREVRVPNLPRDRAPAGILARLVGRSPYFIEQLTFTAGVLPRLLLRPPDIVYFSDRTVGSLLWCWKKATGARFKLLLSNGGPLSPPFPRWDHIQQLTPANLTAALRVGERPERQSLVPYGFDIPRERSRPSGAELAGLRRSLRIPEDRAVVLSVGAVNASRKRMDYVVEEVAALPEPRPFLVMLGQTDAETPRVAALAADLLGEGGFAVRTAALADVPDYYRAADIFVLASLHEGFGRVVVEAMSHGLPCLVHETEIMRYLLGEFGQFGDFAARGSLSRCLRRALAEVPSPGRLAQQRAAYERFSWDQLRPEYVKMFRGCIRSR